MAWEDNHTDPWAAIRELQEQVRQLRNATPLENASITSGSLRIATPEGIRVKDGGTVTVETPGGVDVVGDGSVKAGAAEVSAKFGGHVKAGGTSIGSDGIVRNDGGKIGMGHDVEMAPETGVKAGAAEISYKFGGIVKSGGTSIGSDGVIRNDAGSITLGHRLDPLDGVLATWNGARHTIEQITGWLQGDINSVSGRTTTAQNTANTANATANAAKSATDNHGPRITSLESSRATVAKVNQVIDKLNALEDQVQNFHPTKPINPPISKD